jgi:ligand-binding sensor domain-containing protein
LNRYDGYKFKVFLHDPRKPNGIGCDFIWALFKDRAGKLWVGCEGVLDEFDPTTEQFKHHPLKQSPRDSPGPLTNISEDRTGRLWLASATGLWRFNPRTGEINRYVHDPANLLSLPSNEILWTGEDRAWPAGVRPGIKQQQFPRF